jgi:hypothetical protein
LILSNPKSGLLTRDLSIPEDVAPSEG